MGVEDSTLRVPLELEYAGKEMSDTAQQIEMQLHELKGKLMPLQDYWQGPAKTYYEELQAQWNFAAEGLFGDEHGLLGQIASALNVNWNNYADAEWANVRTWQPELPGR